MKRPMLVNACFVVLILLMALPGSNSVRAADYSCSTYIIPIMQSAGVNIDINAPVLGCEPSGSSWRMRQVSETSNSIEEFSMNPDARQLLLQLDMMAQSDEFYGSVRFFRRSSTAMPISIGNVPEEVDMADVLIGGPPNWTHNYVNSYTDDFMTWFTNQGSAGREVLDYTYWFSMRRDSTLLSMSSGMNPMAKSAFLSNWGYEQAPWPWQLADPLAIAAYSDVFFAAPTPSPTPEPTDVSTGKLDSLPSGSDNVGWTNGDPFSEQSGEPVVWLSAETVQPGGELSARIELPVLDLKDPYTFRIALSNSIWLSGEPVCYGSSACSELSEYTSEQFSAVEWVTATGPTYYSDSPPTFEVTFEVSSIPPGMMVVIGIELFVGDTAGPPSYFSQRYFMVPLA